MGNWSLFLNTCALGGYRNEEVAVPVLKEVIQNYDIDGIFLNAPMAMPCFCEKCQKKYFDTYGVKMPDDEKYFEKKWLSDCTKANIGNLYKAIKEENENIPLILYYVPFTWKSKTLEGGRDIIRDSIYERYKTADLICTEAQDILSNGRHSIPSTIDPMLAMKSGQRDDEELRPFGIIHSCPGMDWRHVGLPSAEYLPWMAQIPASGGIIWHSVTGYPDTIQDKRILDTINIVDHMIVKTEEDMKGARNASEVLLLWDGEPASKSMADILAKNHVTFDLLHDYCVDIERLKKYALTVIPDGLLKSKEMQSAIRTYVENGGKVIVENTDPYTAEAMKDVFGILDDVRTSEYLTASYVRLNDTRLSEPLHTDKIAFRGKVTYCTPNGSEIFATLIPPFAPLDVVGAPPERASIPVSETLIPLTLKNQYGKGEVIYLPFSLSEITSQYKLMDFYSIFDLLRKILCGRKTLDIKAPTSVQVTAFKADKRKMIHLVNETGERPLREILPISDIEISLELSEGKKVVDIKAVIEDHKISWEERDGRVEIRLDQLDVWQMITVYYA